MKKLFLLLFTLLTLSTLFPALSYAQVTLNPCDTTATINAASAKAIRDNLCNIQASNSGNIIRNAIIAVLIIATLISLFFLIRGGIGWILSGGDKAKVEASRQMLIASIIGLIVTFLAYFILSLVLSLFGLGFGNLVLPQLTGTSAPAGTAAGGAPVSTCDAGFTPRPNGSGGFSCVPNNIVP